MALTEFTARSYRLVAPTLEELTAWHKHTRWAPPNRAECKQCGKRIWMSGLGRGAHERSAFHLAPAAFEATQRSLNS